MAYELPEDMTSRSPSIDWGAYADGRWYELIHGEDFTQDPKRAAHAFRQYCYSHGWRCNTNVRPDRIQVRVNKDISRKTYQFTLVLSREPTDDEAEVLERAFPDVKFEQEDDRWLAHVIREAASLQDAVQSAKGSVARAGLVATVHEKGSTQW